MNLEELCENAKTHMTDVGWHHDEWSSKCRAFFSCYKAITESCYPIKSVLNIGVGPNLESLAKNKFMKNIWPSIENFHNLEISNENAKKARENGNKLIAGVTVGDVKNISQLFAPNSFDLIFWNQGPEHIYREEWPDCFAALEEVAAKAIYIHLPWGSGYDGDKWHFSKSVRKGELEQYFTCFYHGVEDTTDAGIMGYKLIGD